MFLDLTKQSKSLKLFVHPVALSDLSIHKLRWFLCKFIRSADPGSFPKTHDLRKLAASYAFFRSMSVSEMCDLVGWSSVRVFTKHYLRQITELSTPLVVLGTRISESAKSLSN